MPAIDLKMFVCPTVRGEQVEILGIKPEGFTGLGYRNGDVLVRYPDGEEGCVPADTICEALES